MLQQTRAQVVAPYYERFLERFPEVQELADAREPEVLALWSGLGYYSRARNLHRAAREIAAAGRFPSEYDAIRALPGVGPYTAAAVSSIAFNAPHAVLDGNVLRVIARIRNDAADIASSRTRARFQEAVDRLIDRRHPGLFNQAMMELGATICLPRAPQCGMCPVERFCQARREAREQQLPVRHAKPATERVQLGVAIVEKNSRILLRQRGAGVRLMPGFWELPAPEDLPGLRSERILGSFCHRITHRVYTITAVQGRIFQTPDGFRWWARERLGELPLTTVSKKALRLLDEPKQGDRSGAVIVLQDAGFLGRGERLRP